MSDKRYLGEPCRHGHSGERYINDGSCCECTANRVRRNRETLAEPYRRVTPSRPQAAIKLPVDESGFLRPPSRAQLSGK